MSEITKYLAPEAIRAIAQEINETGGNEVFFTGYMDKTNLVVQVDAWARGNEEAVPAVFPGAKMADVVIHNHPSGYLTPSSADLEIAARLANSGLAFYIVNNAVSEIYVVIEPRKSEPAVLLDLNQTTAMLQPGGEISKKLGTYEHRPQQIEMINAIAQAFNQNTVVAIEAGTGTGKTMAYLIPAILWSLQNKERIVISTNTINLQEQLIQKDIPFLHTVLAQEFKAVLVKGRNNYVCQRKIQEIEGELDLHVDDHEREELNFLLEWARTSKTGSRSDLVQIPTSSVWEKIASESETCTRTRCPFNRECFLGRARREAAKANILVVNHHLFFADLAVRLQSGQQQANAAVLPPYQRIIFDEAHHIEDVATNYFGSQITRTGIQRILYRLSHTSKGSYKGQLHAVLFKLSRIKGLTSEPIFQKIKNMVDEIILPAFAGLSDLNNQAMDLLYQFVGAMNRDETSGEQKLRIVETLHHQIRFEQQELKNHFEELIGTLNRCSNHIHQFVKLLTGLDAEILADLSSGIIELKAQADRLVAVANTIEAVLFTYDEENVRWIEIRPSTYGQNIVRLQISPLEIAPIMVEAIYNQFDSVVLTSATLTIEQKFDFLKSRIGLDQVEAGRYFETTLPAPFNYKTQALIGIPVDLPDPRETTFAQALADFILESVRVTEGRAFILFTAYGLLNMIYNQLAEVLEDSGIIPLKQGNEDRHYLLERFRQLKSCVLFGTDSFWEGVDVVGEALQSVIITKLPFKVPSEPIVQARVEAIEKRGGNSFMEYSVPLAVLKFKQGFGRLIRSKNDYGCVLILDKRVIQKFYGRIFIRSLPECQLIQGNSGEILDALKKFLSPQVGKKYK